MALRTSSKYHPTSLPVNETFLAYAYRIVPFIPGAYALIAYLSSRPASRRLLWACGVFIAVVLIAFTTVATREMFPLAKRVIAWTTFYAVPMSLAVAVVDALRRSRQRHWLGCLVVIVVCVAAQLLFGSLALGIFGLVNATG
jgi:hypothetical protein